MPTHGEAGTQLNRPAEQEPAPRKRLTPCHRQGGHLSSLANVFTLEARQECPRRKLPPSKALSSLDIRIIWSNHSHSSAQKLYYRCTYKYVCTADLTVVSMYTWGEGKAKLSLPSSYGENGLLITEFNQHFKIQNDGCHLWWRVLTSNH